GSRWLVFADRAIWAVRPENGLVTKIDPVENSITAQTKLHGWASDMAVGGGFVWVSVIPDSVVFRLSEDDLSVQGSSPTGPGTERLSVGAGAVAIQHPSPSLAAGTRTATRGGRASTFRIRRGFRFSPPSNEAVTAETFRRSIERELSPHNRFSPGPQFISDIVGESAYRGRAASHISGI